MRLSVKSSLLFSSLFLTLVGVNQARANASPLAPAITEPTGTHTINPGDVHMEAGPFIDPDVGDIHACTDWEIWALNPLEKVWQTVCISGVEKLHTHLGDGTFLGSYGDLHSLLGDRDYKLRVRFKDNSGDALTEWSPWNEKPFITFSPTGVPPLQAADVALTPAPLWKDSLENDLFFGVLATPHQLRLESSKSELLLSITGQSAVSNLVNNPASIATALPLRIIVQAGSANLSLPKSQIQFTAEDGSDHIVYLPGITLATGKDTTFWISDNGSSYYGIKSQTTPDFSKLARSNYQPWTLKQPGYKLELVSSGLQLPVNIAFIPKVASHGSDPQFYVTELYGNIKVITKDGGMSNYASNLLNFTPSGIFPGSGEVGLSGIAVDSATGDVFAAMMYKSTLTFATYPKIVRFHSNDGGHTAATQTTLLDMVGETQGQSHFVSNVSIGPDHKLYVHMGDGFSAPSAQDLESFRGKILRMNLDGTPATDNPFYDASNGITARDYIWVSGLRNPFGGDWRDKDGSHYISEVGPSIDRLSKAVAGRNYLWNGTDSSMQNYAIYNWQPGPAPVNISFIQNSHFGGSGFPAEKIDHAFITESGPTWVSGLPNIGKRITEWTFSNTGTLQTGPTNFLEYSGGGKASVSALASGPDGLYFADLYKDLEGSAPSDVGANIYRIRYIGKVDFAANKTQGPSPLVVQFADKSDLIGATSWHWDFGDGTSSEVQNPSHTYTTVGLFNVRLTLQSPSGASALQKNGFIVVGLTQGLSGEYFSDINLNQTTLARVDSTVNFDWGYGSPDPSIPGDGFSVRWSGNVRPAFAESYKFYTSSDDGVRLWINGQLIIDNWTNHAPMVDSGSISLFAGQDYSLKMEFYENTGGATATLSWASNSQAKQIIPYTNLFLQTGGTANISPTISLISPTSGATFTAPATVTLSATATDADGSIAHVDFYNGTTLIGAVSTPSFPNTYTLLWTTVPQGAYAITAKAYDNSAAFTTSTPAISITVNPDPGMGGGTPGALPSPWVDADIGNTGVTGSASYAGGVFTVGASGDDIWNGSDAFHFVYQLISGDAEMITKLESVQATDVWAKAGLMIRGALTANSPYAFISVTSANGVQYQGRSNTDAGAITIGSAAGIAAPQWIKLTRIGSSITAARSVDGTTWTTVGTYTLPLSSSIYIGLAHTSHNYGVKGTSVFSSVTLSGAPAVNVAPTVSIISPTAGATFTAPATVTLSATATDADGSIAHVDFYNGTTLIGAVSTPSFPNTYTLLWTTVPQGTYAITAKAYDNSAAVTTSAPAISITVNPDPGTGGGTPGTLPTPWVDADIGNTGVTGSASYASGVFTVGASGDDIWNGSDAFHFVYQLISGDAEMITKLESVQATDVWAKAGLMIRGALTANSPYAFIAVTSANGVQYQGRPNTGTGAITIGSAAGIAAPQWIKLTRIGASITAARSANGTTWTTVGTYTLPLSNSIYIGMAHTSHNYGVKGTSVFSSVTLSGAPAVNVSPTVSLTSPTSGTTFTAPATVTLSATATDADGSIAHVDFYNGTTLIGAVSTPSSPNTYTLLWTTVPQGTYAITAKAYDNSAAVTTSTPAISITVNPDPGTGGGTPGTLPTPWVDADIGNTGVTGSASYTSGVFTVGASGDDIWYGSDAFHYVYQTLNADGEIIAKVESVEATDAWAKAGLMIRESISANSPYAFMALTAANGAVYQARANSGAYAITVGSSAGIAAPQWLKLSRVGNIITAYRSANGTTWTTVGATTLPMAADIYIGIAHTSHNNNTKGTSVFSSVMAVP